MTDLLDSLNDVQREAVEAHRRTAAYPVRRGQRQNPGDYASNCLPHPASRRLPV